MAEPSKREAREQEIKDKREFVKRLIEEVELYEKTAKPWLSVSKDIFDKFSLSSLTPVSATLNRPKKAGAKFSILWSITKTLVPFYIGNVPKAVVRRRYADKEQLARIASEVLERTLNFEINEQDYKGIFKKVVLDFVLTARGVAWMRYENEYKQNEAGEEILEYESSVLDYVFFEDFSHAVRKDWEEVKKDGWVARKIAMTKRQVRERFGEELANAINFPTKETHDEQETNDDYEKSSDTTKRLEAVVNVYEMWHAVYKKIFWFCKEFTDDVLQEAEDKYKLKGFFPCPKPFYGTLSNASLIPVPDYLHYEELAEELDKQTERIQALTDQLKARGIYLGTQESIESVLKAKDGDFIAVQDIKDGGDINKIVQVIDIKPYAEALQGQILARKETKNTIYEITGAADVLRGVVDHQNEKLGQTELKQQNATNRLQPSIEDLDDCIRDTIRIKAEEICELYEPDTIRKLCNFEYIPEVQDYISEKIEAATTEGSMFTPDEQTISKELFIQVMTLLKNDKRDFKIEIETGSTRSTDMIRQKQEANEFIQGVGGFLKEALPAAQNFPTIAPLLSELLLYNVKQHHVGRNIEYEFENFVEDVKAQAQQQQATIPQIVEKIQQMEQTLGEGGQQVQTNTQTLDTIVKLLGGALGGGQVQ